jgi:asparagine synthase (glutamine-hydrolysing)
VTVVLNGDGGDEVFGGYDRFRASRIIPRLPAFAARGGRRIARALPHSDGYYALARRAQRVFEHADASVQDRYQGWISVFGRELLPDVVRPEVLASCVHPPDVAMLREYARAPAAKPLDQILLGNFRSYLPDDLSVKMDRMSMAHSLEARSPFLDTALIEFVGRIPASRKVGVRRLKPLLRDAFSNLVPSDVFTRRKHGFGVPIGRWFRGELGEIFKDEVLSHDARSAEVLQRNALERLYREHFAGEQDHGSRLWTVLTLERWLRSLEGPPSLRPPGGGVRDAVAN